MSGAKTLIKAIASAKTDPAEIMAATNRELAANNDYGAFVTAFLGVLDLASLAFRYSCAGHNPPFLLNADAQPGMIEGARCLALAVMDDAEFFSECLQMSPGQGIYLYTDGVTEAFNPDGDLFGEERLKAVLEKAQSRNAEAIVHAVLRGIQDFSKDTPQSDDITMLALKLPAR